jgi:poly(3-hydroxybutyrate) depolymerase
VSGHTPSPWTVEQDAFCFTVNADFSPVAFVTGDNAEGRANARLIAASPDMLAALEIIAGLTMSRFHKPQDLGNAAIKVARAAIQRATGEDA